MNMKIRKTRIFGVHFKVPNYGDWGVRVLADTLGQAIERGKSILAFPKEANLSKDFPTSGVEILGATPKGRVFVEATDPKPAPVIGDCYGARYIDSDVSDLDTIVRESFRQHSAAIVADGIVDKHPIPSKEDIEAMKRRLMADVELASLGLGKHPSEAKFATGSGVEIVAPNFLSAAVVADDLPNHPDLWTGGPPDKMYLVSLLRHDIVFIQVVVSEKRREKTLAREIQDKLNVAYSTALAAVRFHDLNGSLDHWLDEARALPELSEEERTWTVRCVRCFEPFDDGHAKVCKGP